MGSPAGSRRGSPPPSRPSCCSSAPSWQRRRRRLPRRLCRAETSLFGGEVLEIPHEHLRRRSAVGGPMIKLDAMELGRRAEAMHKELARISAEPDRLVRLFLTPEHRRAADLVARWMGEAG